MVNAFKVAKKEFVDLYNSWLVMAILVVFLFSILVTIYGYHQLVSVQPGGSTGLLNAVLNGLWYTLAYYGLFVGIVIGFASIAGEKHRNALNTLLAKPLYRDSIINGKLAGTAAFLCCVFGLAIAFFTSVMFIVYKGLFFSVFIRYVEALPLMFVLALGYVLIYVLLSMLITVLVRDPAFALIFTVFLVFIFDISTTNNVAGFVSTILSGGQDLALRQAIAQWSPMSLMDNIGSSLYPPTINGMAMLSMFSADSLAVKLAIFLVVAMVASYVVFIRSDVS
ncbi:MAG: ABC transporter permease subunit [Methanocella sp.]